MDDKERIKLLTDVIESNREETELIIKKFLTEISKIKTWRIRDQKNLCTLITARSRNT